MRAIRTLVWVVTTAILVAFMAINWAAAPVNFWPVEGGYLHFEWPIGVIALIFFLLGLFPMWLLHKGSLWQMKRRISALENSVRAAGVQPPLATTTQLEAENTENTESPQS